MTTGRIIWTLVSLLALGACSGSGEEELQQWMVEQRNQTKPKITPIPEPKKFLPQTYRVSIGPEPFNGQRLTQALRQASTTATSNAALVAPELERRKEPLESMPLDNMRMVGSFNKAGQLVAIIKVDNLLYQIKPGNYLGPNYGRVTKVSETEVVMREIVQDAAGEWIERVATLQLQERSK